MARLPKYSLNLVKLKRPGHAGTTTPTVSGRLQPLGDAYKDDGKTRAAQRTFRNKNVSPFRYA